jgi:hypothetical protein
MVKHRSPQHGKRARAIPRGDAAPRWPIPSGDLHAVSVVSSVKSSRTCADTRSGVPQSTQLSASTTCWRLPVGPSRSSGTVGTPLKSSCQLVSGGGRSSGSWAAGRRRGMRPCAARTRQTVAVDRGGASPAARRSGSRPRKCRMARGPGTRRSAAGGSSRMARMRSTATRGTPAGGRSRARERLRSTASSSGGAAASRRRHFFTQLSDRPSSCASRAPDQPGCSRRAHRSRARSVDHSSSIAPASRRLRAATARRPAPSERTAGRPPTRAGAR